MHEVSIVWTWFLNFIGVNNTYNDFSTHMYNFWSGFGGSISIFALMGAIFGIYRHNLKRLNALNNLNPMNLVHKIEENKADKPKQ